MYDRPTVLLFGDSLTAHSVQKGGWGSDLAGWWESKVDVMFRGMSGYNTRWALPHLDNIIKSMKESNVSPSVVTLFWGANDSAENVSQHLTLEEYKANMLEMIRKLGSAFGKGTSVIVLSPPAVNDDMFNINFPHKVKSNEVTRKYAEACVEVAKSVEGTIIIDVFGEMEKRYPNNAWYKLLCDGLHFSDEGNAFIFKLLKEAVKKNIPSLDSSKIDLPFTPWREM